MARFNLNADHLLPAARAAAADVGLEAPCRNPFKSIVVRSVELVQACEEALQMVTPTKAGGAVGARDARAGAQARGRKRRAGCSTIATRSIREASCSTRRSFPPRRRTSA